MGGDYEAARLKYVCQLSPLEGCGGQTLFVNRPYPLLLDLRFVDIFHTLRHPLASQVHALAYRLQIHLFLPVAVINDVADDSSCAAWFWPALPQLKACVEEQAMLPRLVAAAATTNKDRRRR